MLGFQPYCNTLRYDSARFKDVFKRTPN